MLLGGKDVRSKSRKNSRPLEDLGLRAEYARSHPFCELGEWLPKFFPCSNANETHHIFSIRRRPDLTSNLLRLSCESHRLCEQYKNDMRVVCIWVKHMKSELDQEEFKTASGFYLPGWLAKTTTRIDWVQPYLEQLREAFP